VIVQQDAEIQHHISNVIVESSAAKCAEQHGGAV
jgi:hypothetical protein